MQYDYINRKNYSINHDEIFQYFNRQELFNDFNNQFIYLTTWMNELRSLDKNTLQIKSLVEIFTQTLQLGDTNVNIDFNIDEIIQTCERNNKEIEVSVPFEYFVKKSNIRSLIPEDNYITKKTSPILIIPFPSDTTEYLVIDGNHRLKQAKKNEPAQINSYFIQNYLYLASNPDFFMSKYSQFFYLFLNELLFINRLHHAEKRADEEIIKYLTFQNF